MKDCPEYIIALLQYIRGEIERRYWNRYQDEWREYVGSGTNVFEWRAYYWGDNDEEHDKPNFKYNDIEIHWYKYLGRGTVINRDITPEEAIEMFNMCFANAGLDWEKEERW